MKRPYTPPKIVKYDSVEALAEELRNQLRPEPKLVHEVINLLQVITAQCEFLELEPEKPQERVQVIRKTVFEILDRLKKTG
jgi:hypothetical protein